MGDKGFPSLSASPSRGAGGAGCESKVGGGYDRDVALRIVINWPLRLSRFFKIIMGTSTRSAGEKAGWDGTYPPAPGAEILQRVRDDLHAVAKHAIQVEFLVLIYHCW